jgi:3-oxoadipate enol-lactonase
MNELASDANHTDADSLKRLAVDANARPALLPKSRLVPTAVGRLAVHDTGPVAGAREVIVMWPSILADHRMYRAQIEAWRSRYRILAIDGPGHGASGPAPGPFPMVRCAQALTEVLDGLRIAQPVIMIGTSWGGLVAGEFALAQPQRVSAVAMLNTPVHTAPGGPSLGDRFVTWGAHRMHRMSVYRDGVAKAFFLPQTRRRGGPVMDDFHQHLRDADGPALAQAVRSVLIEREALAPRMRHIAAPTLFVVGRHDAMYPVESLRAAATSLPRGCFEILDTAHISAVDAPEETTALLEAFIAARR